MTISRGTSAHRTVVALVLAMVLPALPARAQQHGAPSDGTLVIGAPTDLRNVNSLVNNDVWTGEIVRNVLFLTLVRFNPDLSYAPSLADSWRFSGDTAVTFKLRRDVRWHDGPRTTAYDVAFTFDRIKDKQTAFPERFFDQWQTAQVLDSFTIRFRIEPHADPLFAWAQTAVMPKHLLDSIPAARMMQAAFNKRPVGNGPFRFVSEQPNDRWIFEANPAFPRALGGRPAIGRVVWRVIPDNSAQATTLQTGEIDVALGLLADQVKKLSTRRDLRVISRPPTTYAAVMWNSKRPALSDVRVRRALTMAINRQQMVDVLRSGYGQVAASVVPPWHWAYDRKLAPLSYDVAGARRLLAAAGYSAAHPLELVLKVPSVPVGRDAGELVRSGLADAGVKVTVRPIDYSALLQDVSGARDFDGVFLAAGVGMKLDFTSTFSSKSATSWYHTPQLDQLLDRTIVETDRARATRTWQQVQSLLREE